jgi:cytochrome P450
MAATTDLRSRQASPTTTAPGRRPPPAARVPAPILGFEFLFREEHVVERYHRRLGDVFALPIPDFPLVVIADPAEIKRIFTGNPELLHAGEANASVRVLLGDHSLLLLDEQPHLRQRKLLLPPFHGKRMASYEPIMTTIADEEIDRWPVATPFAALRSMQAITLRVILTTVFGVESAATLRTFEDRMRDLFIHINNTLIGALAAVPGLRRDFGPLKFWTRFLAARDALDSLIYEQIAVRRDNPTATGSADVLSLLLQARYENDEPISDVELRDQLMTLLVAGYETTAAALAWALERLLRHPSVLARLRHELGKGETGYLDCVIKETHRSRPVARFALRHLTEPREVGPWLVPAGTNIAASIWLVHHRADLYPDPYTYRPERFEQGASDTYTWIPFGGGVRRCIGAAFATEEMRIVLRRIIERTTLSATTNRSERPRRRAITFVPHAGTRMILETRRNGP